MTKWYTVEEVAEHLYGPAWRNHPDYQAGKEWVREKLYNGGELPTERDQRTLPAEGKGCKYDQSG